jgi:hypothetical protein
MKRWPNRLSTLAQTLAVATPLWAAAPGEDLITAYQRLGAGPFTSAAGGRAWAQEQRPAGADASRSCATCHGIDLTRPGRHATTGKAIEPMAVSTNPKRLTDPAQVEKWFGRNCRWTLGRECSPQEKGDFVRLIQSR